MDKRQIIALVTIPIVTFFSSCVGQHEENNSSSNKEQGDNFYTETGGRDWIRVPLIKPYEARKVSPKEKTSNWNVDFKSSLGTYNVRKIDVQDSIIYIMSGRVYQNDDTSIKTLVNNTNVPVAWYVIDSKIVKEKGFTNETEFKQYIENNKYAYPKWRDIDSLSEMLGNGGVVPWMPR